MILLNYLSKLLEEYFSVEKYFDIILLTADILSEKMRKKTESQSVALYYNVDISLPSFSLSDCEFTSLNCESSVHGESHHQK